jgi:hypothetical protein
VSRFRWRVRRGLVAGLFLMLSCLGPQFLEAPTQASPARRFAILVIGDRGDPAVTARETLLRNALMHLRARGELAPVQGLAQEFLRYDLHRKADADYLQSLGIKAGRSPRLLLVDLDAADNCARIRWGMPVEDIEVALTALRKQLGLRVAGPVAAGPAERVFSTQVPPNTGSLPGLEDPESAWTAVRLKALEAADYVVKIQTSDDLGTFFFLHATVLEGPRIRTEILRGSTRNVGAVIVYDPESDPTQVVARIGLGSIRRRLQHQDVQGTFFYRPAFSLVIDAAETGTRQRTFSSEAGGGARFTFSKSSGSKVLVWSNASGEIVKAEWISPEGRTLRVWTFDQPAFNVGPSTSL